MNLNITTEERELLLEMLEAKGTAISHEIHHTDSREFKERLKQRQKMIEELKAKIEHLTLSGMS